MPIFKHNGQILYFAHVPRCGGSSIEDYLRRSFGPPAFLDRRFRTREDRAWSKTSPQHISARHLSHLFPQEFFDHQFAMVRHPVDRLQSAFHFQRDVEKSLPEDMDFDAFAEALRRPRFRRRPKFDNHFRAQAELVPDGAKVFRYEDGLEQLCRHIDDLSGRAPGEIALKHALKTTQPKDQISDKARGLIEDIYESDFIQFGYQTGASKARPKRKRSGVIAIKTCVPNPSVKESWGDYHFAKSLARSFEKMGRKARVDVMSEWADAPADDSLDVVLQGHDWHERRPDIPSLIWLIYPGKRFDTARLSDYDHTFVSSETHGQKLANAHPGLDPSVLHQAFDAEVMSPVNRPQGKDLIFVGNNHFGYDRPMASFARSSAQTLKIWGKGWDAPHWSGLVEAEAVANKSLGALYGNARAVLCDHSKPMARNGFLSNRIFDALACGAPVISDEVVGMPKDFDGFVEVANTQEDFNEALERLKSRQGPSRADRRDFADEMVKTHSFDARARVILETSEALSLI